MVTNMYLYIQGAGYEEQLDLETSNPKEQLNRVCCKRSGSQQRFTYDVPPFVSVVMVCGVFCLRGSMVARLMYLKI